jgi:hypothetical protein
MKAERREKNKNYAAFGEAPALPICNAAVQSQTFFVKLADEFTLSGYFHKWIQLPSSSLVTEQFVMPISCNISK